MRERLRMMDRELLLPLSLFIITLVSRLYRLATPKGYVFDEVYYAKDAHSLLLHGVELNPKTGTGAFVVHPPVGKWIISIGIKIFGFHEFGWRFMPAMVGSLSVVVMYYTAKKLFANQAIATIASTLMIVDGLHFVESRTALLDIFLMFFTQCALLTFLHEKYWLTGSALGLAAATKWSGFYTAFFLLILLIYFDLRQEVPPLRQFIRNFLLRGSQMILLPVVVYFFSWAGWFWTSIGWDRNWTVDTHQHSSIIPVSIRDWLHYQSEILNFHSHLETPHPYQSNPWSWLIMGRPTSFYYATPNGCGASKCAQEVTAMGTPLLWWLGTICIAVAIGYLVARKDRTMGMLLTVLASGYLPWFLIQQRTTFNFYVIVIEPVMILIMVYLAKIYLESSATWQITRRRWIYILSILFIIILNFFYILPIIDAQIINYSDWLSRMWLPSWI